MRAVLTRVKHASVSVDGKIIGQIGEGFLVLLGGLTMEKILNLLF